MWLICVPTNMSSAIEIDLRQLSMVSGKKGFQKIVRAFNDVLNSTLSWLFCDFRSPMIHDGPIGAFQPKVFELGCAGVTMDEIATPVFPDSLTSDDLISATELLEWLSLVSLASPRVQETDQVDPILSRYRTPQFDDRVTLGMQALKRYRWHGFIPAPYILQVLFASFKSTGDKWFALSATSFTNEAYTILKIGNRLFAWEYTD